MNKAAIKRFAIEARNKLRNSVTDKAGMLGITPGECSGPVTTGSDFEVYQTAAGTEITLNKSQCELRKKLVDKIAERGFDAVVEEVAYHSFWTSALKEHKRMTEEMIKGRDICRSESVKTCVSTFAQRIGDCVCNRRCTGTGSWSGTVSYEKR